MKYLLGIVVVVIIGLGYFLLSRERSAVIAQPMVKKDSVYRDVEPRRDPNPFVNRSIEEFEAFVKTAIANRQAPGAAIAIVRDTNIIFLKGYGLRDITQTDSVNTRTVFRLGSVSKSVTATLAAILVNKGIIQWDDPVNKYLPEFRLKSEEATKHLTLRHLLSHTMGLPYHAYTIMVEDHTPYDTLVDHLKDLDLVGRPGELYSYQNVGFSVIGGVIEKATGRKLVDVFEEQIFRPLGMSDASASFEKIMANNNVARPHALVKPMTISSTYYSVAPAGGLNASIQDMALWLKALMGSTPGLLPQSRLDEIFTPQVAAVARNSYFSQWKRVRKSYYGLGWRIITFDNDTIEYHGGYVNHYRCEVAVNRKKKIAIALLVNSPGMLADQGVPRFYKIYDHYLDSINHWKPKRHL